MATISLASLSVLPNQIEEAKSFYKKLLLCETEKVNTPEPIFDLEGIKFAIGASEDTWLSEGIIGFNIRPHEFKRIVNFLKSMELEFKVLRKTERLRKRLRFKDPFGNLILMEIVTGTQ
jgi:hypothetical protein